MAQTKEDLIKQAESLYEDEKYEVMYNTMKKALQNPELRSGEAYWRLARCCRDMANQCGDDKETHKAFMYEAFEFSKLGVDLEPENWSCNKWYAILLDLTARFEGIKKRIENSYLVKDHLLKALEKNPSDATTLHSLGVWCFEVADLPWYQQKIASAFFATPPTSKYEEALNYLLEAEKVWTSEHREVNPNFYSSNLLYLGKCYLRMKNKEQAGVYLKQCHDYNGNSVDDVTAKKEAADLLKKL